MTQPSAPFDEFTGADAPGPQRGSGPILRRVRAGMRALSCVGLWIALAMAILIVALDAFRFAWASNHLHVFKAPKTAIPLIIIGISYISLIFSVPRTAGQRFLGVLVGLAFVFWGTEQFLDGGLLVSLIDDIVVFLFVLDLSIVIRQNLAARSK